MLIFLTNQLLKSLSASFICTNNPPDLGRPPFCQAPSDGRSGFRKKNSVGVRLIPRTSVRTGLTAKLISQRSWSSCSLSPVGEPMLDGEGRATGNCGIGQSTTHVHQTSQVVCGQGISATCRLYMLSPVTMTIIFLPGK